MFKPGSIRKIKVENFVTYTYLEVSPGPNLNMVLGPNGSGKSTLLAAIILGLGGTPKVVGRGAKVSEYVKYGCSEASIDIYLQKNEEEDLLRITRWFDTHDKNVWSVDGRNKSLKEVLENIQMYNIQVNNLCQFLPQDRVQHFARMNKQEILKATQDALCREGLIEKQEELIQSKERINELSKSITQNEKQLAEAKETNLRLEPKVQNFNKKKMMLEDIQHIDRKIAWVQYEKLRQDLDDIKQDKVKAAEVYKNYKEATLPMEKEIKSAKENCIKMKNTHSNINKILEESHRVVEENLNKHNTFEQSISRATQDMNLSLNEIDERHKEIDSTLQKIEELKSIKKKFSSQYENDQQFLQNVKKITSEMDQLSKNMRNIEDKKNDLITQSTQEKSTLRMMENDIKNLENVKQIRMDKLYQVNRDVHKAVVWLRNNKHLFQGKVCEPMMLEINVLDHRNAIFLENVISKRDILAFICEKKDDMNLLIQSLRNQQQLSINVLHSSAGSDRSKYQPNIPIEQLRRFGLYAYLDSLISAPDLILNYLYKSYGIQNIPVGDQKVNECFEQIAEKARLFFSGNQRYSVNVSKYSGARSVQQNQIVSNGTLSASLDVVRLETLKGTIDEKRRQLAIIQSDVAKFDEHLQGLSSRLQELQTDLRNLKDLKQKIKMMDVKYAALTNKIEELRNASSDKDKIEQEGRKKIQKITKAMVAHQRSLYESIKKANELKTKSSLSLEKIELAKRKVTQLENDFSEKMRRCRESEETLANIKDRYADVLGQAKTALKKAKNLSGGFTPAEDGFAPFKELYDRLSDDFKSLQNEKDQITSKLDLLKTDGGDIMKEYEERIQLIKSLDENLDRTNLELNQIRANMQKLEEEWLNPLAELVTIINERFAQAFARLKCSGEVSIWTGDDLTNYAEYGLSIKVSYRQGEPLQELNSTTQSGGERAVATAIYMLALQELTPVPFRCVDEINQGMDATNERRIIELLFECTMQINSPQYFFITPKRHKNCPELEKLRSYYIFAKCHLSEAEVLESWGSSS